MSHLETEAVQIQVTPKQDLVQPDSHDEEYESADDTYEEVEEIEIVEVEETEHDKERSSSSQQDRELDDDEDIKNPQFIPKRGYFYEHDDRTKEEEQKAEEEPQQPEEKKKEPVRLLKDKGRWAHDMYNEDEQTPKSKVELAKAYGYEIWNEEQAPRARRRRRYGRGPNRYTRHWEEEEAYQKPRSSGFRGRGGRGRGYVRERNTQSGHDNNFEEHFPPLSSSKQPFHQPKKLLTPVMLPEQQGCSGAKQGFGDQALRKQALATTNRERGADDRSGEHDRIGGGGVGGVVLGGRGRGRRNEYSNRNRYPNRRDGEENIHKAEKVVSDANERLQNRDHSYPGNTVESDSPNATDNNGVRDFQDKKSKDWPLPSKPPFTNTEYTRTSSPTAASRELNLGTDVIGTVEKPNQDLRDVINARRLQQNSQNERTSQTPLRLQRIQQPHHSVPQQQQSEISQQQVQGSTKPKRYSVQRQRQAEQPAGVSAGVPEAITTSGPISNPVPIGLVPNMVSVVSEQLVSSPVPVYPAPNYYDGPQVYEAAGSPVTIAANGASVSPSLWSHAYPNAPYPSPPSGPQVPQAAYADHAGYIAAQQPGPIFPGPPYIQDPTLINYPTAAPPFSSTYHSQSYQAYPQVTPAHPPELYHGGVTYYNPTPQIQRQPILAPKRTKTVLQLVEPPEKAKNEAQMKEIVQNQDQQVESYDSASNKRQMGVVTDKHNVESELPQQLENPKLLPEIENPLEQTRTPSPIPTTESWSAQMEEINCPTELISGSFQDVEQVTYQNIENESRGEQLLQPQSKEIQSTCASNDTPSTGKPTSLDKAQNYTQSEQIGIENEAAVRIETTRRSE